ncbi:hypothetical protein BDV39DRAFT_68165 [Aspergillus sergii]|uniref:Uncharacterized protein n=1 Tax=Aspergillus sergii TaxID=1034303 RepID=A0A5N6X5W1_9EURO|nr:hypothetical protein BDV39DRAFT_68165 [Aspergillus sergii]
MYARYAILHSCTLGTVRVRPLGNCCAYWSELCGVLLRALFVRRRRHYVFVAADSSSFSSLFSVTFCCFLAIFKANLIYCMKRLTLSEGKKQTLMHGCNRLQIDFSANFSAFPFSSLNPSSSMVIGTCLLFSFFSLFPHMLIVNVTCPFFSLYFLLYDSMGVASFPTLSFGCTIRFKFQQKGYTWNCTSQLSISD